MSRRARAREGARPWEAEETGADGIPWEDIACVSYEQPEEPTNEPEGEES